MTTIEDLKNTAKRIPNEFFNRGDYSVLDECFTEDFVVHGPQGPAGKDMLLKMRGMLQTGFPGMKMTIEDVIGEHDRVVLRISVTGKHEGDFMGIAPTGKEVKVNGMQIWRFSGDKVTECWFIRDDLGLMQEIGGMLS